MKGRYGYARPNNLICCTYIDSIPFHAWSNEVIVGLHNEIEYLLHFSFDWIEVDSLCEVDRNNVLSKVGKVVML